MKVSVIGGGSTYTPELVKGFIDRIDQFPLSELWLMDIDQKRLATVGGFAQRIVKAKGSPFKVILSGEQRESIAGSKYVITQLRVGKMDARRADEYLGLRHGLVGQETTGIGGMAKALRTIPIILDVARDLSQYGGDNSLLVNFTNPAGLLTQALHQYAPDVNAVGVCNIAVTAKMGIIDRIANVFGEQIDPARAELDTLGLNHLSWHRGFKVDGEERWSQVIESYLADESQKEIKKWEIAVIQLLHMLPNYYLKYFYDTNNALDDQLNWPPSRADEVIEIEKDLLELYDNPQLDAPPEDLMKRGGAYYSTVATQLLNAHANNLNETHVLNIANQGAVESWPSDWVLEMPARVNSQGISPIPCEPLPPICFGLIAQVKAYEQYTVEAAVHGDRQAAFKAMLAHPLGPDVEQIPAVLDDMLLTHRKYLPKFWES
jgi:6-phospho-beta-glucosidase